MQEAVIKFASESAASTACLLNNALVDGSNIKVEAFPSEEDRASRQSPGRAAGSPAQPSNESFTSILSGIASSSKSMFSSVSAKVKAFDQQYGVSDTIVAGATTAWTESKRLAGDIDNKYQVSQKVSSAVQSTKEKVMGGNAGQGSAGSPRAASPRPPSPSAAPRAGSPNKF